MEEKLPPTPPAEGAMTTPGKEARQWSMALHLSQFAGYVVPLLGLIAPIVIWQIKKDEFPSVDEHGRLVVDWLISACVYFAICFVLTFVLIGILGYVILGIMAIAYPIIGGIKANNGEVWAYPGAFRILRK